MTLKIKPTKNKVETLYKTIYIKEDLVKKINKIANDNNTSFNNVVISIIEDFFERESEN